MKAKSVIGFLVSSTTPEPLEPYCFGHNVKTGELERRITMWCGPLIHPPISS